MLTVSLPPKKAGLVFQISSMTKKEGRSIFIVMLRLRLSYYSVLAKPSGTHIFSVWNAILNCIVVTYQAHTQFNALDIQYILDVL